MFATVFIFAFITVHVTAEIPSYIHVCGRRDPNINQCIMNNVENLKNKLCDGIPELYIESNNPLLLDTLTIINTPENKIYFRDVEITGLCDYIIHFIYFDIDKLHFDVDLLFTQLQINGTYDIDLRILATPIIQKGKVYFTSDNVGAKVNADLKIVTKNGKRYVYISKMKVNLDIKGYNMEFDQIQMPQLKQLNEIVRNFLGNNQKEIIRTLKPFLEEVVTKQTISVSNRIVTHFTYEELFPDRT
ncbi:circadian clock-controlled protein daywake-like [Monomorium pharaonis]|uniref:circadian clock-controlled protein daywake-like n=1 Tax=Monomorium pharaonis TaxID=307658 RepID=UPI00063FC3C1|nr:circadian clock-controlled protein daywake-like [Monomorium pharaonis]